MVVTLTELVSTPAPWVRLVGVRVKVQGAPDWGTAKGWLAIVTTPVRGIAVKLPLPDPAKSGMRVIQSLVLATVHGQAPGAVIVTKPISSPALWTALDGESR